MFCLMMSYVHYILIFLQPILQLCMLLLLKQPILVYFFYSLVSLFCFAHFSLKVFIYIISSSLILCLVMASLLLSAWKRVFISMIVLISHGSFWFYASCILCIALTHSPLFKLHHSFYFSLKLKQSYYFKGLLSLFQG